VIDMRMWGGNLKTVTIICTVRRNARKYSANHESAFLLAHGPMKDVSPKPTVELTMVNLSPSSVTKEHNNMHVCKFS
jgi:hypothetical protein